MIWKKQATIQTAKVTYFVSKSACFQEAENIPLYGIGIIKGDEMACDPAFSPDKEKAIRMAETLYRMQVTPTTFYEIMDDYLATT